jgi:pimeloyl-ACP methyl ester carboxylesterase
MEPPAEPTMPLEWPADDALPVRGWGDVDRSIDELWNTFTDVSGWAEWNPCISWARITGGELREGSRLIWVFKPIKRWYPYLMPATAKITEVIPGQRVTWKVSLPGFRAFHSYVFEAIGPTESRFGSWEIARGPMYRFGRRFWLAHFRFVCAASIAGAATLGDRTVRLVAHGPDDGRPPIVAIPGIDGQPGSVGPIVKQLAQHRRVLLVDYSRELTASPGDLAGAIADLIPDRCDLVGQSIGTWIAAEVAVRRRSAVRRVVLISPFTRVRNITLRGSALGTRLMPRWLYRTTTPTMMAMACGPVGDGRDHPFLDGVANSDQAGVARRTRWQVNQDVTGLFRSIEQPTALVLGGSDRFVPRRDREWKHLTEIFSRSEDRVEILDDAGHVFLPSESVDQATRIIVDFLA